MIEISLDSLDYKRTKKIVDSMLRTNYKDFFKAIVSCEKNIDDEVVLDNIYENFLEDDNISSFLNSDISYIADKELGLVNEEIIEDEEDFEI